MTYTLSLEEKELQLILSALGELPAKHTFDLLTKIMHRVAEDKAKPE